MQIKEDLNNAKKHAKEFIQEHKKDILICSSIIGGTFVIGKVIQKEFNRHYTLGHNIAAYSACYGAIKVVGYEKAKEIAIEGDKLLNELTNQLPPYLKKTN